ncbi:hypothetical protein COY95_00495 [Candidatus Woesearchaeota archaeon CG_4_10_14_0_8_um_filter_47_5]|nr:MAG: hypothetical protein COY95_00495 [Candidatus Woesearchaeota archaeon CG_4_10_14_0_8_um_filter_47_5]
MGDCDTFCHIPHHCSGLVCFLIEEIQEVMMGWQYSISQLRNKLYVVNNSLSYRLGKPQPPSFVLWDATHRCNLACIHCSAVQEYENELPTNKIHNILDELADLGVSYFQVTGGEPLLRKDIFQILTYAHTKGLRTTLATSGYYVDEKKARALAKARISVIQVSIDGPPPVHNAIRKNTKSFAQAVAAITLLKQHTGHTGAQVGVATTVMPANIEELSALRRILEPLNLDFWTLGVVMPVGRARANPVLYLSSAQFHTLLNFIQEARTKMPRMPVVFGENFPYLGTYDEKVRKAPMLCPAGIFSACIGVDGHVRGCPDQPDTPNNQEGDLNTQSFTEIWNTGFRRYREHTILSEDAVCSTCPDKTACYGGCLVMREQGMHCIRTYGGQM